MNKLVLASVLATSSLLFSNLAMAGSCVIHITRTACPGMEKDSYAKCGGKASCDETKKTGSEDACAKAALDACENAAARQKQTKSKSITADYDGKPVQGGKNFCEQNRPDFNKCG